jgi:DNA-binding GntR family transcriptional regulator
VTPPAKNASTTAVVGLANSLREAIANGAMPPGRALVETELCASFGVSRVTVREALRMLSAEGLTTYVPHRGCVVARLSETDAIDIYRVRRLLEIEAVRQCGPVSTSTLEAMRGAIDDLERMAARRDWLGFGEADQRFHALLVSLLGSRRFDSMFASMARELRLALSILDRTTMGAAVVRDQREIFRLIVDGRNSECVAALERHLDDSAALLVGALREQQVSPPSKGTSEQFSRRSASEMTETVIPRPNASAPNPSG